MARVQQIPESSGRFQPRPLVKIRQPPQQCGYRRQRPSRGKMERRPVVAKSPGILWFWMKATKSRMLPPRYVDAGACCRWVCT